MFNYIGPFFKTVNDSNIIILFIKRVGCDLVIGSEARVDICGVCGGDGSTCTQPLYHWVIEPASLCSVTCGNGKSWNYWFYLKYISIAF